jgi:phosphate transport system protein
VAKHLQREVEHLKKMVLSLGAKVEERVREATIAIDERDARLAKKVIDTDPEIDSMEVDIEEECLKILALHQPVAIDLRFIVAVLKINNDLERIADLAVNIAERAAFLATQPKLDISFRLRPMAQGVKEMLRKSLDALVNLSEESALKAIESDNEVDKMNRDMYMLVQEGIRKNPGEMESLIHMLSASRHLERIGDHATNIAEDVIYMISGEVIRHKTEQYGKG